MRRRRGGQKKQEWKGGQMLHADLHKYEKSTRVMVATWWATSTKKSSVRVSRKRETIACEAGQASGQTRSDTKKGASKEERNEWGEGGKEKESTPARKKPARRDSTS